MADEALTQAIAQSLMRVNPNLRSSYVPSYGTRTNGTQKGEGYFGKVPNISGDFSTELSANVNLDGKDYLIPLLTPNLNRQQIQHLLGLESGTQPPKEIVDLAVQHAISRMRSGKDPFAQQGEQQPLPAYPANY